MIKKIRSLILKLAAATLLLAPLSVPAAAYAATDSVSGGLCAGTNVDIGTVSSTTSCTVEDTSTKIDGIVKLAINVFSLVVGIIAVVMIIIGGLKYITSGGDSGNITGAKNTIIYAIVGLVVVALAQFIVHFVLTKTNSIT